MKSLSVKSSATAGARSALRILKINEPNQRLSAAPAEIARLAIPSADGLRMIKLSDILYICADSNYSIIHLVQGEKCLISKSLKHVAHRLGSSQFIRSHHSYVVNANHIESLHSGDRNILCLSDGTEVPVSRRLSSEVRNYLTNQFSL